MSEAPKKIWIDEEMTAWTQYSEDDIPYVRADLVDDLVEALKSVTAHLAAAHSLLQRGGKKAAASNTMFEIMLNDYEKSIDAGKAALG